MKKIILVAFSLMVFDSISMDNVNESSSQNNVPLTTVNDSSTSSETKQSVVSSFIYFVANLHSVLTIEELDHRCKNHFLKFIKKIKNKYKTFEDAKSAAVADGLIPDDSLSIKQALGFASLRDIYKYKPKDAYDELVESIDNWLHLREDYSYGEPIELIVIDETEEDGYWE